MTGMLRGNVRLGGAALLVVAMFLVAFQDIRGQGSQEQTQNLMYARGQSVIPSYEGWHPNADGTIDLWFGYLNENWQEEVDIPVGPNNSITPAPFGPDGGQPTHFLPRNSRWQFAIRVPKDFGDKEIVWTLTSHGQTHRTYASLKPGYIHDDNGMQREYFGTPPQGNKAPVLTVEGARQRTARVGQPITLTAVATDDGLPRVNTRNAQAGGAGDAQPTQAAGGGRGVGGDGTRQVAKGLRLAWFLYRGPDERASSNEAKGTAALVTFNPQQFKTWEDQRGGSPWAPTWVNPPIPPRNTWVVQATFREPGTYVLRCQTSDGLWFTQENVTFTVAP